MEQLFEELKRRNVLRIAIAYLAFSWLLIQIADTIFPAYDLPGSALTVLITMLVIGFVPAVILSWTFDLTPEGVKRDRDVGQTTPVSAAVVKKLDRLIIVVLVLALGYFAFDRFVLAPDRAAVREAAVAEEARFEAVVGFYGDRSIAVLPFENMSSDPEQEYFGDGIAEDISSLLGSIRELRVIARSSAFAFKGKELAISEIAERLDVGHILEGSVRKSGNRVRVTAQLIQARTNTQLWAQTYDGDLEDIFAIQDEIAGDVTSNLQIELLRPLPQSRVTDPEVIALTQQAKQISEIGGRDKGERMRPLLQRALEIDPDYVPALEWLGSAEFDSHAAGFVSDEEFERRGDQIIQRILTLDPNNATITMLDAFYANREDNDLERAAELFERALSHDATNSNVVNVAGLFAIEIGKFDTAIRILNHATAIDPLCYQCLLQLSRAHMHAGNFAAAEASRRRFMAIGSGGAYELGLMKLLQGDAAAALAIYQQHDSRSWSAAGRAMAHHDLGENESAEAALAEILATESPWPGTVSSTYAWMGRKDAAFEWLRLFAEQELTWARFSVFKPEYRNLHDDPRWDEWRESIGRSAERLDAIAFDPDLPE